MMRNGILSGNIFKLALAVVLAAVMLTAVFPFAASAAEQKKYLTKGDAVAFLTASDFLKNKIGALLSWTIGYDISKVNRAKVVPVINYILAIPRKAPPDGRTIIELQASVDDPGGLVNIQGVRADLSEIGKLSNMMLVDNGLWGDAKAEDGIFTIQTNVSLSVSLGEKEVAVAVANQKGWVAMGKTSLLVLNPPKIISAKVEPMSVVADGKHEILFKVQIEDPEGKYEIKRVFANLQGLGAGNVTLFSDEGGNGDEIAGDFVYSGRVLIPAGISPKTVEVPVYAETHSGAADFSKVKIKIVAK